MEHLFITYELAMLIKEKGFNEPCFGYFDIGGNLNIEKSKSHEQFYQQHCLAPLYQQAFKWFREKHLLHSTVEFEQLKEKDDDEDEELYQFKINEQWSAGKDWCDYKYGFKHHTAKFGFKTYEEAQIACLYKLIKIVNKMYCYYSCMDCEWEGDVTECEFDTEYDEFKGIDRQYPICPKCSGGVSR